MTPKNRTLAIITLPLLAILFITVHYFTKNNNGDLKNSRSDYEFSSKSLNKEFLANDSAANAIYGSKIIELTGPVANIRKSEMHGIIITLDDPMMGIKCVMDSTIKSIPTDIALGTIISLKGICIGSDRLIGVMLNQCIITGKKETATSL